MNKVDFLFRTISTILIIALLGNLYASDRKMSRISFDSMEMEFFEVDSEKEVEEMEKQEDKINPSLPFLQNHLNAKNLFDQECLWSDHYHHEVLIPPPEQLIP